MPKILPPGIREKALAEARDLLSTAGYSALNMRAVAARCDIAVGTLYNYFPCKEYLTGCVVLEDWNTAYQKMKQAASSAAAALDGIRQIYALLCGFVADHQYLYTFDLHKVKGKYAYANRHSVLLEQITALLRQLLIRFIPQLEPDNLTFLAESLLNCSVKQYQYAQIQSSIAKLLVSEKEMNSNGKL